MELTPVQRLGNWCYAKRDDLAFYDGPRRSSGSKVRQYMQMADACPGAPMIVGCSAFSAQQIYVADAAERTGREGIVCIPKRKILTDATKWALKHGAKITQVSPGYPSIYRAAAKAAGKDAGGCVRWNPELAIRDTAEQCLNIPRRIRRIVVPTGSGLVAIGILIGLAERSVRIPVLAVAVSGMAKPDDILNRAMDMTDSVLPDFQLVRTKSKYETPVECHLHGITLDPFYAAKAVEFLGFNDCLWITGRRPIDAMPG